MSERGIFVLEEILMRVVQSMSDSLDEEQLDKLQNVLFVQFHGKMISEEKNELSVTGTDSDTAKVRLFVASKKVSGRQDNTLAQYVREISCCRNALNKKFEDITTMDLRWYFGMLRQVNKISMVTLQGRMRYLNSFWTFLEKENLVKDNPVARIEALRIESTIKKAYTAKELEGLRLACRRSRDRALVEFLYATGVRVSELCSLKVKDIDLYKQEFMVMGKGRKERHLYISDVACFHLFRYFKERMEKESLSIEELAEKPLFATVKKPYTGMTPAGVQYLLKQLGKKAGVGNVHPHRFRRTFATDLLNRGMRIEEVMVLMGHTKIETTLIYCNIKEANVREAYRKYVA